jgi:CRP-like cAMP-binding protein
VPTPFILKLQNGVELSAEEQAGLLGAMTRGRVYEAHQDIITEGTVPSGVNIVLDGFACRYKLLPDGTRQIMTWLLPGDACDLNVFGLGALDHSIATLSASTIAFIPNAALERLSAGSTAITRALWWTTLVDDVVLREWLVAMGRRPADQRIAHLFCELAARLAAVGLADRDSMELPITQTELADTVGLTSVHVNRIVQQLRDQGLIAWRDGTLSILRPGPLRAFAEFDPTYLHLPANRDPHGAPGAGEQA